MNKGLKIFTITALLGVLATGCSNNAKVNTLDKNLANLQTTVNNSVAGNANDFFINEFDGVTYNLGNNANYNSSTNTLSIDPSARNNSVPNSRAIFGKNIDTYRRGRNTNNNTASPYTNTNNSRNYYITDGSYVSRYADRRDENVVANKVKNIENLYSIAYDVSLAKAQFNELRQELLDQIDATRENLDNYETLDSAQQAALQEYATTIRNIIDTINTSNALYKNNMIITGTQNVLDNQAFRSAQYINMLNCIDTQISALENALATLSMINNSILNNNVTNNDANSTQVDNNTNNVDTNTNNSATNSSNTSNARIT